MESLLSRSEENISNCNSSQEQYNLQPLESKTSTIPDTRTKSREPDITVALFQGLKELTLYEPHVKSFDSFPSLRQLNLNFGVTSAREGSICVWSSDDPRHTHKEP
jgi:hypothetical protein